MSLCLYVSKSVCLSVLHNVYQCLYVTRRYVYMLVYLFVFPSVHMLICHTSVCLYAVCVSVCLSLFSLSLSVSVSLSLSLFFSLSFSFSLSLFLSLSLTRSHARPYYNWKSPTLLVLAKNLQIWFASFTQNQSLRPQNFRLNCYLSPQLQYSQSIFRQTRSTVGFNF